MSRFRIVGFIPIVKNEGASKRGGLFLCPIKKMQKVAQMQKVAYLYTMTNAKDTMKITKKNDRLTQLKQGRKIVFEVLQSRTGKFNSFQHGLGVVLDCDTLEECIESTKQRLHLLNGEFKKRLV